MFTFEDDDFEVETFADFTKQYKKEKRFGFLPDKRFLFVFALILIVLCAVSGVVGYELGYRGIVSDGYEVGYAEGNDLGYNEGLEMGKKDGYDIGYEEGGEAAKNDLYYGVYGGEAVNGAVSVGADTVYCTASGTCYHWEGCSYIAGKANLNAMSESDAVAAGYDTCSRCGK